MEHFLRILGATDRINVEQVGLDLVAALLKQIPLTSGNKRFDHGGGAKVQVVSLKCRLETVSVNWWAYLRKHRLPWLGRAVAQAIERIERIVHKLLRSLHVVDLAVNAFRAY